MPNNHPGSYKRSVPECGKIEMFSANKAERNERGA